MTPLAGSILACVALTLSATTPAHADAERPASSVEWRSGRLSVDVDAMPFRELFAIVASKTGVEIRGLGHVEGNASMHLAGVALRDGLATMLNEFDYVMFDAPPSRGRQTHIVVNIAGHRSRLDAQAPEMHARIADPPAMASDSAHRPAAYEVVQGLSEQGDVDALRDAASTGDSTTRALAIQRLARLEPDEARRVAVKSATSEDTSERVVALQVLGGLDSEDSAHALGAALFDREPEVRHAAVVGLMGQRSPVVASLLERATHDHTESIRLLAMDLLAQRKMAGVPAGTR
jgi:hypothetical protein